MGGVPRFKKDDLISEFDDVQRRDNPSQYDDPEIPADSLEISKNAFYKWALRKGLDNDMKKPVPKYKAKMKMDFDDSDDDLDYEIDEESGSNEESNEESETEGETERLEVLDTFGIIAKK